MSLVSLGQVCAPGQGAAGLEALVQGQTQPGGEQCGGQESWGQISPPTLPGTLPLPPRSAMQWGVR